jgi:hypothetical protein
MKMKNLKKIFFISVIIVTSLTFNSCDPFDELYLTLAMETEFRTVAPVSNVSLTSSICLSEFDDYNDNSDKLKEIRYISAAYFTLSSSNGLTGDLRLKLYRGNTNTLLFDFTDSNFNADLYLTQPMKINLTQQEIDNINSYLTNPQVDKCFRAELEVLNANDNDGAPFQLNGKVEFLTELQIEP